MRSKHSLCLSQRIFHTQNVSIHSSKSYISHFEIPKTTPLLSAHNLFDEMPEFDVVSATKTITRLSRENKHMESLSIFRTMLEMNITPNQFTFGTIIPSITSLKDLNLGKQIHSLAKKIGLCSNVFVGSAILNFYSKLSSIDEACRALEDTYMPNVVSYTTLICGYLRKERFDEAFELFGRIPEKNVVTWNAVIGGLGQTGRNEEALDLFIRMLREGYLPNQSTFSCVISSVANIAALGMGRSFHASAIKFLGSRLDVFVSNSLISFYSKCGNLDDSVFIFDRVLEKSIVSWNALICGYARNGRGKEAMDLFQKMKNMGVKPNSLTLLGVLMACNYIGLVHEGYLYFNDAKYNDPGILKPEHYACMIDSLSRFGLFKEAKKFINDLPFQDLGIGFWKALLGGCQIHNNFELGEIAAKKILSLDPGDFSSYVMLSNAHSAAGRWEDVSMVREKMRERGMKRVPGCSWIEIKNCVYVFTTGDRRHCEMDEIYMILEFLYENETPSGGFELLNRLCIQLYDHTS